ncbi:MAG: hypothetical protein R3E01_10920 [Pirellulaceae bacterium]|nr:outer membrane lipoprotein carrier protein LolA [Planctomycetales bacterium]
MPISLDQIAAQLANATSARFKMVVTVHGQPAQSLTAYYMQPGRFRQEFPGGEFNVADWEAGKMMSVDPNSKRVTVFHLVNAAVEDTEKKEQKNQFEMIRDLLVAAANDPAVKFEELGKREWDGKQLLGFRILGRPQPMTVWTDPTTNFPVRIETTVAGPPKTLLVMDNYEANVELDPAMFSLEIPEGYQLVETDVDASMPAENDLVNSLRLCREIYGELPAGLDTAAVAYFIGKSVAKQGVDPDTGPSKEQMQQILKIGRGFQFAATLLPESEAHFVPDVDNDAPPDQVLFWYRPAGGQIYRVIHADFSVTETATAPNIEGAQPLSRQ